MYEMKIVVFYGGLVKTDRKTELQSSMRLECGQYENHILNRVKKSETQRKSTQMT